MDGKAESQGGFTLEALLEQCRMLNRRIRDGEASVGDYGRLARLGRLLAERGGELKHAIGEIPTQQYTGSKRRETLMPEYLHVFESYRRQLDGALEQVSDAEFLAEPEGGLNSIATIIRHLAGNFRSRFTDLLTTDGEKEWRDRESEFAATGLSRQEIMTGFGEGWQVLTDAVSALQPEDLSRTITIRQEPVSVDDALLRSVTHFAGHVGQVLLLARQLRGSDWKYLSIPPGGSDSWKRS